MPHAESEILINRPPAAVFDFLLDGLNNPRWRNTIIDISLASGSAGQVGATYVQVLTGPGGRKINGDYELTKVIPGKEIVFKVITGPARPTGSYSLEAIGDATKVKFVLNFQPKGLARLMGSMIQKAMRSEVAMLSRLKDVIETS